jgi:hypothetical protein
MKHVKFVSVDKYFTNIIFWGFFGGFKKYIYEHKFKKYTLDAYGLF